MTDDDLVTRLTSILDEEERIALAAATEQDNDGGLTWTVKPYRDVYGFAEVDFVIQGSAGGREAEYWRLTRSGRELAELLAGELETKEVA